MPRRTATSRPAPAPPIADVDEATVEEYLRTGEHAQVLAAYFGESEYAELRELALRAAAVRTRGGPRVYVLPGIMGSKIGKRGKLVNDILWLDPADIAVGRLVRLALPRGQTLEALGVMLFGYLKLKLTLEIGGFDASFHAFDWRLSLEVLGAQLLERIERDPASEVMLVAHSMGGLVARAAMTRPSGDRIARLVQLGTPNFGSFAPVQALRATYPTVRKIAAIDTRHTAEDLARKVFRTLPGLYQMLPAADRHPALDLFDVKSWPHDTLLPDAALLEQAREIQASLAVADDRCHLIAGVNRETVTAAERRGQSFEYVITREGDGTVPLALARWDNASTWYIDESHGGLTNNGTVATAAIDLLRTGQTTRLPDTWKPARRRIVRRIRDTELRRVATHKVRWSELSLEARRRLLEPVLSPEFHGLTGPIETVAPALASTARLDQVIVSRRRQRMIEIRLAHGSITDARARALVLGVFRGVEPGGAAAAVDERLDGAVKEFTLRRMFSGELGEVFAMPAGRSFLFADLVLFAGLGDFDRFGEEAQRFVTENIVRTFARTQVEDFATVLLGTGSGVPIATALRNQLAGFFQALTAADPDRQLRRITLCELDADRCDEMRRELLHLSATPLFEDVEVVFDEVELPAISLVQPIAHRQRVERVPRFAYLIVSQQSSSTRSFCMRASILTAGSRAAVLTSVIEIARKALDDQLRKITSPGFTQRRLQSFGEQLAALVLPADICGALDAMRDHHLVVVHDVTAARIPWETICVDGWFPAASRGLSRRYAAEHLPVARWDESRRQTHELELLLVVNPTSDLPGAAAEGERLREVLSEDRGIRITQVEGEAATHERLVAELKSGRYDVVHYAGHAFFDPEQPARSGLLCSDEKILDGRDLAGFGKLPALVFFNACEAGRVRAKGKPRGPDFSTRMVRNVGLAESFLRGGVANYIGTYWPVGDAAAETFSSTFYEALVDHAPLGEALNAGREAVRKIGSIDWADYVHYGSYDFILKTDAQQ
jgi:pimeloyl-ACP methyl ester carboxylesterase